MFVSPSACRWAFTLRSLRARARFVGDAIGDAVEDIDIDACPPHGRDHC